jgi:hypothetical protein
MIEGRVVTLFEHSFQGQLQLPEYVYHGTLKQYIEPLRYRVLDNSWWRKTDRDFGAAFYTTNSLVQAKKWALQAAEKALVQNLDATGAVIKIKVLPEVFPKFSNCLVFLGHTNPNWTRFIVDHRLDCTDDGHDPCGKGNHPSIIIGQMADNKMEQVYKEYEQVKTGIDNKYHWFYEKITQDKNGITLDSLELGNQIAFCEHNLNEMLHFEKYYIADGGGWKDYDRDIDPI